MADYLNGRYRIIEELSEGGFGKTFLAEDTHLPSKPKCVIKQFKPAGKLNAATYKEVLRRFELEAGFLEVLSKENRQIPKLYAFFSQGNDFYIVQELIDGVTLERKIQSAGRLDEETVKDILAEILPVLVYTHAKGIIHRDIKPQNIIIRLHDGKPVLIDFGAVKEVVTTVLDAHGTPVRPSIVIGTAGYIPPEQARGIVVFASDLYSLAVTAIASLTGRQPLELVDPLDGEFRWQKHVVGVTPGFAEFLDTAIEPDYRKRYRTAEEMLKALQAHIKEEKEREAERVRAEEEAARRRTADLYEQAHAAMGAEDWPAAEGHLKQLLKLDPSNAAAAAKLNEVLRQQELAQLYAAGLSHFKAGRWPEALDELQRLKKHQRNYKDVDRLISECEGAVIHRRVGALYDEALREVGRERWAGAIEKLNAILALEPTSTRAAAELKHVELLQELDSHYKNGRRHYESREWAAALACFNQIKDLGGDYKDVTRLIKQASKQLDQQQRQEREAQVAGLFEAALKSMEDENWSAAVSDLEALLKIDPSHADAAGKLEHCKQRQGLLNLYDRGKEYYRRDRWAQALHMFQKVRAIEDEYRDVQILISKTQSMIQRQTARRRRITLICLGLLAMGVLGLLLSGTFSPALNVNQAKVIPTPTPTPTPQVTIVLPSPYPSPTPSPSATPTPPARLITVKFYLVYDKSTETVLITLTTAKGETQKDPDEGNPVVFNNVPCGQSIQLSGLYSYDTISEEPIDDFYDGYLGCDKATVDLGRFAVHYDPGSDTFTIERVRPGS